MSENKIQRTFTIKIPTSWVPTLHKLAAKERLSAEKVIIGALGEELAKFEEEQRELSGSN